MGNEKKDSEKFPDWVTTEEEKEDIRANRRKLSHYLKTGEELAGFTCIGKISFTSKVSH